MNVVLRIRTSADAGKEQINHHIIISLFETFEILY